VKDLAISALLVAAAAALGYLITNLHVYIYP
jgi:hypothetical protein